VNTTIRTDVNERIGGLQRHLDQKGHSPFVIPANDEMLARRVIPKVRKNVAIKVPVVENPMAPPQLLLKQGIAGIITEKLAESPHPSAPFPHISV
jgi:hypothetical protein